MTCASDISFVILFAIFYVTSICNTITFLEIVLFIWVISWGVEEIRQIKDASKFVHDSPDPPNGSEYAWESLIPNAAFQSARKI